MTFIIIGITRCQMSDASSNSPTDICAVSIVLAHNNHSTRQTAIQQNSNNSNMGFQWDLNGCCGAEESIFLAFYAGYVVLFFITWQLTIVKPMRLLSVFVHEFGHASACWMTGGQVDAIEVYNNEGGVTKYRGGCRVLVIPAGYVGGAFWGGAFVALSGGRIGATIVASIITAALLVSLW